MSDLLRPGRAWIHVLVVALVGSCLALATQPVATAAGISNPGSAAHQIIVFPLRDFVSAAGYASSDRPTVEVVRGGAVVGTASNLVPQDDPDTPGFDGIVEVNHPGGGCWRITPDIRPRDVVRVLTAPGTVTPTPTANMTVTQSATKTADDTVVIKGTAVTATGARIPLAQLEARVIAGGQEFQVNGRRSLRASSAGDKEGVLAYDPNKTTWTATFTGLGGVSPVDGLSDADRAVNSQSRVLWLGRNPGAGRELTIFEHDEVAGPADPCTAPLASGPSAPDMTDATDTGASNSDNITRNNRPTFRGVAGMSTATSVRLYVDGVLRGTTSIAADRTYSLSPDTAITDGPHQVTASEIAPGAPETTAPQDLAITVDTNAPASPGVDGPFLPARAPETALHVTGTASPGPPSASTGDRPVPHRVLRPAPRRRSQAPGSALLSPRARPRRSSRPPRTRPGTPPPAPRPRRPTRRTGRLRPRPDIDPASTHGLVTSTSATFSFSDSEADVSFECARDGGAFAACTSPKTLTGLSQGEHTFSVRAIDRAGNVGAAASTTWTVDSLRPIVTIQSGPAAVGRDASPVFGFSTTEAADTFCSLVLTTAADSFEPCTSPKAYTDLPDGRYRFTVKAVDPAGNTDIVTQIFRVDTKAPLVRLTGKPAPVTSDNTPTFTVSAQATATTQCSLQPSGAPTDFGSCTSPATFGPLDDGPYTSW